MESVCDDPDVIAANILVGDTSVYHYLYILCALCMCGGGGGRGGEGGGGESTVNWVRKERNGPV